MIIVDAGVWVRALVDDGPAGVASRRALADDLKWVAPAHAPIEVLRTIRRYESTGLIGTDQAATCALAMSEAEVHYVGPDPWLLGEVWRYRHNISPYDAPYIALAEHYDCALVTLDERLARAGIAAGVRVVVPQK